jgi:hypothetical protein
MESNIPQNTAALILVKKASRGLMKIKFMSFKRIASIIFGQHIKLIKEKTTTEAKENKSLNLSSFRCKDMGSFLSSIISQHHLLFHELRV